MPWAPVGAMALDESRELVNLGAGIARTLTLTFFGWFGGAMAVDATVRELTAPTDAFPQSFEVIPGKLRVRIFLHEIKYGEQSVSCWSYLTDGLWTQKQKEIIFTLQREKGQKPGDYPRELLDLFGTIFQYAERGKLVEAGDATLFGETGFLGRRDFRGIGYVEPQGFPGVETKGVPLLAGILLKGDEAQIAWDLGLTRITALLGMKYQYYPYPTWSDLKREPVASLKEMEKSVFGRIVKAAVHASYYEEKNHIFLSVQPSSRARLQEYLGKLPLTGALVLRTQPDPRANACLVWQPGQTQPTVITPPNSNGSRKTGAFLAFVPEQDANRVQIVEDGFSVFLTNSAWQKIRDALLAGADVFVPPAGMSSASVSVEWAIPATYTSPVTGSTYTAEKWTTYEPDPNLPPKERVAVSSSRVVLLTSEQDLQAHTSAEDLGDYLNSIEKKVDAFFTPVDRRTKLEITMEVELTTAGHSVRIVCVPELSGDVGLELYKQLNSLPSPKVTGPAKLDFILSLWNVPGKQ